MRWRASEQHLSERIGLRLYAMALEPIWSFSNGSSISLRDACRRMSVAICISQSDDNIAKTSRTLCAVTPMPATAEMMIESTLREYVCPVTAYARVNPASSM